MKKVLVALMGLMLMLPASVAPFLPSSTATTANAAPAKRKFSAKAKGAATRPKNAPKVPATLKMMSKKPAPPSKGGKKTKAVYFTVNVDSHVNRYVNVWVDDDYAGVVGPYGNLYETAVSGPTHVYCEDAYGNYWNFNIYATGGTYTVSLYP